MDIITSQDGGVDRHFTSSHNQKKDNRKFKNKKNPELPENRTVWKSDNQIIKKETFIQTSRMKWAAGRERMYGKMAAGAPEPARWEWMERAVPQLHADKPGGTNGC